MKHFGLLLLLVVGFLPGLLAQETVTSGFLMPRVTTADRTDTGRFPLSTPVGTQVYDTDTGSFWYWNGAQWLEKAVMDAMDTSVDIWEDDATNGMVRLGTESDGRTVRAAGTGFVIKDDGKVGIGTEDPSWKLDVRGGAAIGHFKYFSSLASGSAGILFARSRGSLASELDIEAGDHLGGIRFRGHLGDTDTDYAAFGYVADGTTAGAGHFSFTGSDELTEVMAIATHTGNVGIGDFSGDEATDRLDIKQGSVRLREVNPTAQNNTYRGKLEQAAEGQKDRVVVAGADGVLKSLKAVLPKFFFMPSVLIPTAEEQLPHGDVAYGFDGGTGTFTIDLYQKYIDQYTGVSTNTVKNPGATEGIPVLPSGALEYHITWYDDTVFDSASISVSDAGVLTYQLLSGTEVTESSFMNIIFVVKEN
ncbi:hypothetical protein FKX85_00850 [Echinicola soli]|uniref:Uncharacterized protein n=1 Tax=Echinicola soli TaxID=2591634 RepID=A0A514CCX6_9BACT|nr:hypothetical protein [Echinicola soli]QDH77669.1 hypothetical protein FKX85_00850 [Echinicola soli]